MNQHLYQYIILTDHLSKYSEEIHVKSTTPDYVREAKKYDTSLHITP